MRARIGTIKRFGIERFPPHSKLKASLGLLGIVAASFSRSGGAYAELLAVGEHYRQQAAERLAISNWRQGDGNFISWLEGLLGVAERSDVGATLRLDGPLHSLAIFAFDVEAQKAMGIGPKPFDNRSLHGKFLRCVKRRGTVMREKRSGNDQKAHKNDGNRYRPASHGVPP
jgi:hypothetical protein